MPQVLSLLSKRSWWISQIKGSFPYLASPETLTGPWTRQKPLHTYGCLPFPSSPPWWSPTLPTDGQIHSCNCAKLLCRDVHRGSVCNSENWMQTAC